MRHFNVLLALLTFAANLFALERDPFAPPPDNNKPQGNLPSGGPQTTQAPESTDAKLIREWKNQSGKSITAEYIYADNDKLITRRITDGVIITIPLGFLSKEDVDFLAARKDSLNSSGRESRSMFLLKTKIRVAGTLAPVEVTIGKDKRIKYIIGDPSYWALFKRLEPLKSSDPFDFNWVRIDQARYEKLNQGSIYHGTALSSLFNDKTQGFYECVPWSNPDIYIEHAAYSYTIYEQGGLDPAPVQKVVNIDVTVALMQHIGKNGLPATISKSILALKDNGFGGELTITWRTPQIKTQNLKDGSILMWPNF